jgi:hypothetical protein
MTIGTDICTNDASHHQDVPRTSDRLRTVAIAQFYGFAERCIDWAKTTRSLQERAVYVQMALQWLAAGARLQTFLQLKKSKEVKPVFEMEGKHT